eukprot:2507908-Pleurochrysis_carterae.AAC.1
MGFRLNGVEIGPVLKTSRISPQAVTGVMKIFKEAPIRGKLVLLLSRQNVNYIQETFLGSRTIAGPCSKSFEAAGTGCSALRDEFRIHRPSH